MNMALNIENTSLFDVTHSLNPTKNVCIWMEYFYKFIIINYMDITDKQKIKYI